MRPVASAPVAAAAQEVLIDRCSQDMSVYSVHGLPWWSPAGARAYGIPWTAADGEESPIWAQITFAMPGHFLDAVAAAALAKAVVRVA